MFTLKNNFLEISIKDKGAELTAISSVKNTNQFLWHADPNVWGSHAPNLFPIIGAMKDDSYNYDGKTYSMTKHGFVRQNKNFVIKNQSETSITFSLSSNADLYKMYPFLFEFELTYILKDNILTLNHCIKNLDSKPIYFSVGGHPAFTCPLYDDENYDDYHLEFETEETSESYLLNMATGLVTSKTIDVFSNKNTIKLHKDLFNNDALIFKDLKSRKVTLSHKTKGAVLSVAFKGFPYLGIWAKPNAPYVCIEPWLGIADAETTTKNITEKEGIIKLEANTEFNASYSIEISKTHLG